jgi:hypothetical protein
MNMPVLLAGPAGRPQAARYHRPRLVALALVALTALSAGLQVHQIDVRRGRLSTDEHAYLRLARDVVNRGHWGDLGLKQPFRWAPGTPMVFAATAEVTGRPVDRHTAYDAQVFIGSLLVPSTFLLAFCLTGPATGLAAAAGVAVYVPLIHAGATAGTETLGALMIVIAAVALVYALRPGRGQPARFAAAGAALGAAALVRGDLVPVAVLLPVSVAVAMCRATRARQGLGAAAAMLAGAVVLMTPWSILASSHAHHIVPVTDGGAANLFVGTDLPADGTIFGVKRQFAARTRRVHPAVRHVETFALREQLVLDAVASEHPRATRDAALRAAAMDNVRRYLLGHPVAFAGMEARKLWRMWGGAYAGTRHHAGALSVWEHRVLALLALLGLTLGVAVTRDVRLVLLAVFLTLTTAVDVAFVSEARHNVRLMPLLLATGAAGWAMVMHRARVPRRSGPLPGRGT